MSRKKIRSRGAPHVFQPIFDSERLAPVIMAAAKTSKLGTWACWIGIVLGKDETLDLRSVLNNGVKLKEGIARAIFPRFKSFPYENGKELKDSW